MDVPTWIWVLLAVAMFPTVLFCSVVGFAVLAQIIAVVLDVISRFTDAIGRWLWRKPRKEV